LIPSKKEKQVLITRHHITRHFPRKQLVRMYYVCACNYMVMLCSCEVPHRLNTNGVQLMYCWIFQTCTYSIQVQSNSVLKSLQKLN